MDRNVCAERKKKLSLRLSLPSSARENRRKVYANTIESGVLQFFSSFVLASAVVAGYRLGLLEVSIDEHIASY